MKKLLSYVVLCVPCMVITMLLIPALSEARVISVQMSAQAIKNARSL